MLRLGIYVHVQGPAPAYLHLHVPHTRLQASEPHTIP